MMSKQSPVTSSRLWHLCILPQHCDRRFYGVYGRLMQFGGTTASFKLDDLSVEHLMLYFSTVLQGIQNVFPDMFLDSSIKSRLEHMVIQVVEPEDMRRIRDISDDTQTAAHLTDRSAAMVVRLILSEFLPRPVVENMVEDYFPEDTSDLEDTMTTAYDRYRRADGIYALKELFSSVPFSEDMATDTGFSGKRKGAKTDSSYVNTSNGNNHGRDFSIILDPHVYNVNTSSSPVNPNDLSRPAVVTAVDGGGVAGLVRGFHFDQSDESATEILDDGSVDGIRKEYTFAIIRGVPVRGFAIINGGHAQLQLSQQGIECVRRLIYELLQHMPGLEECHLPSSSPSLLRVEQLLQNMKIELTEEDLIQRIENASDTDLIPWATETTIWAIQQCILSPWLCEIVRPKHPAGRVTFPLPGEDPELQQSRNNSADPWDQLSEDLHTANMSLKRLVDFLTMLPHTQTDLVLDFACAGALSSVSTIQRKLTYFRRIGLKLTPQDITNIENAKKSTRR
ncbi:uncharacterized protein PV09_07589 [Verruconis gallopava]|uniref:Uncharacterized protein n=1 Tax=Verruconis gallopava TaxID=253628 RepID=A0A0D2ANY1_9PEZI|nr:uncharacterized protein PV09_07589 [Verruconis gallopava]KIW00829.1 hypothetical protein PV09_07589 [Verruconis gallopava]